MQTHARQHRTDAHPHVGEHKAQRPTRPVTRPAGLKRLSARAWAELRAAIRALRAPEAT